MTGTRGQLADAAANYERDKLAPGSWKASIERVAFWTRRATELGMGPFPLNVVKSRALGSLLHAGGYRSAASYLSAVKMERIGGGG